MESLHLPHSGIQIELSDLIRRPQMNPNHKRLRDNALKAISEFIQYQLNLWVDEQCLTKEKLNIQMKEILVEEI